MNELMSHGIRTGCKEMNGQELMMLNKLSGNEGTRIVDVVRN